MSVRLSTGLPRACSGLMYAAVPRIIPAAVARAVSVGECVTPAEAPDGRVPLEDLREAEVEELDSPVGRDLDVRGLEVAVDDPLLVRRFQGLGDLPRERERFFEWKRAGSDLLVEALAFDELHDEKVTGREDEEEAISSNE